MAKARKEVELSVRIGDNPGSLGKALAIVASRGVNVLAYCSYNDWNESVVMLVTDNAVDAKRVLEEAGFHVTANSVVLVGASDQIGAAAKLGAALGDDGIDIIYSYASSCGGNNFFAVFKTSDDDRAIRVLEAKAWAQAA